MGQNAEKVERMRSAWISLATRSGAVGLGGKQAVVRAEGGSLPGGFSRPLSPLDVVWSGRGVPAAGSSLLPRKRGQLQRKAVKVTERVRDACRPLCQPNGVALSWSRSRPDVSERGPGGGGEVAHGTRVL